MTYFWASALPVFLPVALLLAGHWATRPRRSLWFYVLSSLGAFAAGIAANLVLPATQVAAFNLTIIQIILLLGFLLWQFTRYSDYFWQVVLVFLAALQWGSSPALMSLTSTHVINTDLLLNLASVIVILALCMGLSVLVCRALQVTRWLRWPVILVAALALLIPASGNFLLSLMKLQIVELTGPRLSYAAKATKFADSIGYVLLAATAVLVILVGMTALRKRRHFWKASGELIEQRIALASYRDLRSLLLALSVILAVMFSGQFYWDRVASLPPQLSEATRVTLSENNDVRLPLMPLMDGNLHRFAWVASDGKVVRFFVINRLADKIAPAVVFDACLLCGDKGYVQKGDQISCVGCGVHLFKPSIGKPGGCNPVPIEGWSNDGETITIPGASLDAGLQLFSTVLTIDVTDPVTGAKLTNTEAQHRYNYAGKTYFFADEKALEAFRDDPEKFIGKDAR
jgi:Predicted membrane protein